MVFSPFPYFSPLIFRSYNFIGCIHCPHCSTSSDPYMAVQICRRDLGSNSSPHHTHLVHRSRHSTSIRVSFWSYHISNVSTYRVCLPLTALYDTHSVSSYRFSNIYQFMTIYHPTFILFDFSSPYHFMYGYDDIICSHLF